jgi:hypothetical protein
MTTTPSPRNKVQVEPIHLCIERVVPDALNPAGAAALRMLQASARGLDADYTLDPNAVLPPSRMAVVNLKKWENGRLLRCRFLDGSRLQRKRVEEKAHLWEQYANLQLKFVNSGPAEIRIAFTADPGSWSAVGTDALIERYFPKHQPTMNYGWLKDDTADAEYARVVLHEFGHALGCIHEHQSPAVDLQWNEKEVIRIFSGPPNYWDLKTIRFNILMKYGSAGMSFTPFDINSIMLYHFPGALFKNGVGTPMNMSLSDVDKRMMAQMYPQP